MELTANNATLDSHRTLLTCSKEWGLSRSPEKSKNGRTTAAKLTINGREGRKDTKGKSAEKDGTQSSGDQDAKPSKKLAKEEGPTIWKEYQEFRQRRL
jgi:hypothetical protein